MTRLSINRSPGSSTRHSHDNQTHVCGLSAGWWPSRRWRMQTVRWAQAHRPQAGRNQKADDSDSGNVPLLPPTSQKKATHPIDLTPNVSFKFKPSLKAIGVWVLWAGTFSLLGALQMSTELPFATDWCQQIGFAERTRVRFGNRKDKCVSEHKRGWFSSLLNFV